jgi:GDPmannose 4,6-dehydratase
MYVAKLKQYLDTLRESKDINFPPLRLGNLEAKRDWGYAPDYCNAMYQMLQQDEPGDYMISTQETHSIKDFLDMAFGYIGISDWKPYVVVDPKFYRPIDVEYLLGDSGKIRSKLGWKPTISFNDMVFKMVKYDLDRLCNFKEQ